MPHDLVFDGPAVCDGSVAMLPATDRSRHPSRAETTELVLVPRLVDLHPAACVEAPWVRLRPAFRSALAAAA